MPSFIYISHNTLTRLVTPETCVLEPGRMTEVIILVLMPILSPSKPETHPMTLQ